MGFEKRTHYQILLDCRDMFEDWIDGENPRVATKILLKEIYERTTRKGTPGRCINHALTAKYEQAKELVKQGFLISIACQEVGITRDQWNRRARMERTGRDRQGRREY